jgi:hypothetical protein
MRWLPDGRRSFGPDNIRIWRATERLTKLRRANFGVSRRRLAYWEPGKTLPAAFQQRLADGFVPYYRIIELATRPLGERVEDPSPFRR